MKVQSPYVIKEIKFRRTYPGYIYRREIVEDPGGNALEMVNCYSSDTGHWIGSAAEARYLCKKKGLRKLRKSNPSNCVVSLGFNEKEQKWYGWSHRAICGFGIGDKIYDEKFSSNDDTPFIKHGKITIKNMKDAKKAAINFSNSVS